MNRQQVFLFAGSVVFALLVCEAAERWILPVGYRLSQTHIDRSKAPNFSPPIYVIDPEIGWVLSPETIKSHPVSTAGFPAPDVVYSVSHGARVTSSQPHSGPIILVTGASVAFDNDINDEDTWPWLLQENLPDFHVVNVAAGGYGTDQALLIAERWISHAASEVPVVVIGFDESQIERNRCTEKWLSTIYPRAKPLFVRKGDEVEYRGLVKFWSYGNTIDKILDHSTVMSRVINLSFDKAHQVESYDGGKRLTVALVTTFARRFQSRGIKLVVAVLPYVWDHAPKAQEDRSFVVDQLNAAGIPTMVMDIPRLPNGRIDTRQFMAGVHPNRQYNSMLANQVTQFLSAQPGLGIKPLFRHNTPAPRQKSESRRTFTSAECRSGGARS